MQLLTEDTSTWPSGRPRSIGATDGDPNRLPAESAIWTPRFLSVEVKLLPDGKGKGEATGTVGLRR